MALNKEVWIRQIKEKFYPDASFLKYVVDFSGEVENNRLHIPIAGADPEVFVNNTTYPIGTVVRTDEDSQIALQKYETENTSVFEPETVELSYNKLDSVLSGHRNALRTKAGERAAHAYAPQADSLYTPVIETTGEDNGSGKKRMKIADILTLKKRYDLAEIPADKRFLVLHPEHVEDLLLENSKVFKDIAEIRDGKPMRFAGFQMLEFSRNPKYSKTTLEKIPYGAAAIADHTYCSFSFYADEVMKADGAVKLYKTEDDPKTRSTIVGFDKRFIALPIRNIGMGAIVSVDI